MFSFLYFLLVQGCVGLQIQDMSHAFLLCFQVKQVVLSGKDLDGDPLSDFQAVFGQLVDFVGIVGEKPHAAYSQVPQYLRADVIFSLVSGKAKSQVRLQGIHALLLQFVSPQFVDQSDSPAFLTHVEQDSPAFFFNLCHG